jgi:cytochrome P450
MARETLVYGPDVDSFKPERFLGSNPPRDMAAIFGYGRRGCPGRLFAEDTVFLAASRLLFLFDIVPPADGSPVKARFKDGLFSCVFSSIGLAVSQADA